MIRNSSPHYPAAAIDYEINDGDVLPFAGGIKAIHAPGHSAGQLAFFWPQHGGVLFAADACANLPRLDYSLGYEDIAQGRRTLAELAKLNFAVVCFGHGNAIRQNATQTFRKKWGIIS